MPYLPARRSAVATKTRGKSFCPDARDADPRADTSPGNCINAHVPSSSIGRLRNTVGFSQNQPRFDFLARGTRTACRLRRATRPRRPQKRVQMSASGRDSDSPASVVPWMAVRFAADPETYSEYQISLGEPENMDSIWNSCVANAAMLSCPFENALGIGFSNGVGSSCFLLENRRELCTPRALGNLCIGAPC
jgi:hypothetical protein